MSVINPCLTAVRAVRIDSCMLAWFEWKLDGIVHLPFCLFLTFTMFLSLEPPRVANGCRAGEDIAIVDISKLSHCVDW